MLVCLLLSFITLRHPVLQDATAPLWMAAQMGHSETVRVLLLRGADRDAERQVKKKCVRVVKSTHKGCSCARAVGSSTYSGSEH